jgi:hypothetical protein
MKLKRITLVEGLVCLAIIAVLAALLLPAIQPRTVTYTNVAIPPLTFDQAELEQVVNQLDVQMQNKGRRSMAHVLWQSDELKHRRVTVRTSKEMPLRQVLRVVEENAGIKFDDSGKCGTCGGPISTLRIRDAVPDAS